MNRPPRSSKPVEVENPLSAVREAWLAAIVDSSDDAIIGKTLDGTVRSWNAGATRLFGYDAQEMIGRSIMTLIPSERAHEEKEIVAQLSRGDRIDHFETIRLRKDGTEVEVSLSVSPIRGADGTVVGAAKIARNIGEAKRLQRAERELAEQLQAAAAELEQQVEEGQSLQEELEQTNEELSRSLSETQDAQAAAERARSVAEEANRAKSQFLAVMSHELRTPLNAIAGYVDLLELELHGPLTDAQREDIARLKRSQETLKRLIEDVLGFAKLESGRLEYRYETVRLDELLDSLDAFVAPRLSKKGLSYRFLPCGTDLTVSTDRGKVEQIVLNLLSNAVKFTDSGSIDIQCGVDDERINIRVIDSGRGIAADLLDTIFEPFVQADRSLTRTAEGTGLGLSISRQLARGMGGDIAVESQVGVGSVFTLVLPRTPRPT
jgi:PAS domain S-box-containing protein